MSALREFQHGFARALLDSHMAAQAPFGAGFSVYRNTVMKGLLDVLRANFPTVLRLVGDEWFDAAALQYARQQLPAQPALALYGVTFPEFLKSPATAAQLPYLPWVAELDRLWTEVHFAADSSVLQARQLAALSPHMLSAQRLQLHPAARFMRCMHSAASIWCAHRPPVLPPDTLEVVDAEDAVLVTRPEGEVRVELLSLADHEFLRRLQAGDTLGEAASALLAADASIDVAALLAILLNAGAFSASGVATGAHEDTLP